MIFDSTYSLVIIGMLLCLAASAKVKSTFKKYSNVRNMSGCTGVQAAERILRAAGIYDVQIERDSGNMTDHYDPRSKVIRLSAPVYGEASISAVGVAAHECGHAIQHARGYTPLAIRGAMVPVVNFSSAISWPLIFIGFLLGGSSILINLGIILFAAAVIFQLVTLPVEFNASSRAVKVLGETGILQEQEKQYTKKVLGAAALTYVAAAAASILQLIRLLLLSGGRSRD